MNKKIFTQLIKAQKREITEYNVYLQLAKNLSPKNAKILSQIAKQEKHHYEILKRLTKKEVAPSKIKIILYLLIAKIFGLNFTLQLMEKGERNSQSFYRSIAWKNKELKKLKMVEDETEHEKKLIALINEKRLTYIGAFVLGLNDALVELTGTLAGLTLALNNTKIIAMVGLITGIAASMSMSVSNYLAAKEENDKSPKLTGLITGIAYIITVGILIIPYLIINQSLPALILTLFFAILIIAAFTFYAAVVKREKFTLRFLRMAFISLSVAIINFGVGFLIKKFFEFEV